MRFENYLVNEKNSLVESIFQKHLKSLSNIPARAAKRMFRDNWNKLVNILKKRQLEKDALDIINRRLKTKYRNLDQVSKKEIESIYEDILSEDFKHYWELVKTEGFPPLVFYSMLKVFLELDKLLGGIGEANYKTILVYGLLWLSLITGKFLKGWEEWRKENPREYEEEGKRKNPFSIKPKK